MRVGLISIPPHSITDSNTTLHTHTHPYTPIHTSERTKAEAFFTFLHKNLPN